MEKTAKQLFIETYGCQMNVYDTELVASIMKKEGYSLTDDVEAADAVFVNTCAIRENAEHRVLTRLNQFKSLKKKRPGVVIGVLGCMAKHIEKKIIEQRPFVDIIMGPDSYKNLPELLRERAGSEDPGFGLDEFRIDTRLSRTEVYEDIIPFRQSGTNAWIAIMRGCDNFCTFCVVPFTRGRERSRTPQSVVDEARRAVDQGFKEITLLGQNVNSYSCNGADFAALMARVSDVPGLERIRFTSPHPKDFPTPLLHLMAERENICSQIHLPVQSGSNRILELMNRTYTRETYLDLVAEIRTIIPDVALTTDVITGFPTETEDDHLQTVDLFHKVEFDAAFTFKYSPRPNTKAFEMRDDVDDTTKTKRLQDIISIQKRHTLEKNRREIGNTLRVLIEGTSKKRADQFMGRTMHGKIVVFSRNGDSVGDTIPVRITDAKGHTLFGEQVSGSLH